MKRKRIAAVGLLLACCLLLGACSKELPLNRRMIVQSAGVDESADGLTLSVNAYLADRLSVGESENTSEVFFSRRGDSVADAMDQIGLVTGREPYFPHNQAVVIGRPTALHGIGAALSFFTQFYECRGAVALYLAEGTAEELLRGVGQGGSIPARELASLSEEGRESGCAVYTEVFTAAQCLTDGARDFCVPILGAARTGAEEERIAVVGTALFSGEKMVAALNERQTRGVLIASGGAKSMSLRASVPAGKTGGQIAVQLAVKNLRTAVRCGEKEGLPTVALQVRCDAFPEEWDLAAQTVLDETTLAALQTECERELRQCVEEAIAVCVKRHAADPFGFGRSLARQLPNRRLDGQDGWKSVLAECEFSVAVSCSVKAGARRMSGKTGKS